MLIRRLSSLLPPAFKGPQPAATAAPTVSVLPPGHPRTRSISFVYGRETYNPLERRVDRAHSYFKLSQQEQDMTGLPESLGHGPGNPGDRDTIELQEVDYRPSKWAQTGPVRGKVWTRQFEGRDLLKPDPAAGQGGHEVELGKLTQEGAVNLRTFVDNYDNKNFDVTGVLADNCAQFSLAVADKGLGLEIEKEEGRHDTSASAGAKIEAAAHKMQQSTSRDRYPYLHKP